MRSSSRRQRSFQFSRSASASSSRYRSSPMFVRFNNILAFSCGHQTCSDCGEDLVYCPVCQVRITTER
ncbi:Zinc finger, RING/FYVE/PHD-type [Parasponia andersonii]|uniref:Zinc finger, RING/FYVE/PHD-type n=1 Tax=Parasponia andersonii TaxID=3476 RepID=A0A2P5C9I7_PARAD|nr:Zinc finger, RING/FYVE/PHD-type [Parasponia andersonii]